MIIVKIMTIINFQLTLQVHTISSVYITMYGTYENSYIPLEYANQGQRQVRESEKYADLSSSAKESLNEVKHTCFKKLQYYLLSHNFSI